MMIPDPYVLLDVRGLQMHFPVSKGVIFQSKVGEIKAVDGVSFQIMRGETLGLVGESGLRQDHHRQVHSPAAQTHRR